MQVNKKILLILGSHAHVPTGSDEKDFENAYNRIMRPFIANLYRYSNIQAVLHYSGVLLNWVERTHPEFFMLIEDMVTRKQTELLSGGFYEPMFPLIPQVDRVGQIEFLTTYLRKHFGKRPTGIWIPYMVWEQNMASSFSSSEMQYTFLSGDQFYKAGLSKDELYFPCITEDQGKIITVFPVSLAVEKELEQKSFSQVFVDLKSKLKPENRSEDTIVTIFPEKISSDPDEAPDTAWNRFFEEVSLSEDIVETILPNKYLKTIKTLNRASFPDSAKVKDFNPRRYLIDHCQTQDLYSKMIFTNVLINQLKGDKSRKQNAREELWKAQDSNLFIPGNEINKNKLRKTAYSALIRAELLTREKSRFIPSLIQYDFDFDGIKEIIYKDALFNCCIQIKGAGLFDLDYLPKEWNYLDCGSRVYKGVETRRVAFADVILPYETKNYDSPDGARRCFIEQYKPLTQDRKGKSCFKLSASNDGPFGNIEITKCYSIKKDILSVSYQLKNTDKENLLKFCFTSEIVFSFAGEGEEYARFYSVNEGKDYSVENEVKNTAVIKILDVRNEVQILLTSANRFSGCLNSISDNGQYQATSILPLFNITLEAGKTWTNEFTLKFSH